MRAAILAVGSELLSTDRLDTHSLRLAELLETYAVELVRKSVVADDEVEIAEEIGHALARAELLLVTGGLGPTADDVTREGCARALGRGLVEDAEVWRSIQRRFAAFGRTPSENNRRQALVPAGGAVLANDRGTAPGLRLEADGGTIFLLPGVPHELEALVAREVEPWLTAHAGAARVERRTLRVAMRPESEVDRALAPLYEEQDRTSITLLAAPGEVAVRITAAGEGGEREAKLEALAARVRDLLGDAVYGERDQDSLEQVVGELLSSGHRTLATAESCTGGLVAARLTRVAGASAWFAGGVVAYSNAQKVALLDVAPEVLARHGAVSEAVARAMATGVRRRLGTDLGVAVTGIAGPTGGSAEKPVGTVHVAVSSAAGTRHRAYRLPGDRERVRAQAAQAALDLVRRELLAPATEVAG